MAVIWYMTVDRIAHDHSRDHGCKETMNDQGRISLIIAGLTGGIATGKSTVAGMFRELGAEVVDADLIARDVVKKGAPAWKMIKDEFGDDILLDNHEIDREKLGDLIFNDTERKDRLNRIVHPAVFHEIGERIKQIEKNSPDAIVILDVPLLIEAGMQDGFSNVILVYVPEEVQAERLMQRDGFSKQEAFARIRSQMPIEEKKTIADIVIDNTKDLEHTRRQAVNVYTCLSDKLMKEDA